MIAVRCRYTENGAKRGASEAGRSCEVFPRCRSASGRMPAGGAAAARRFFIISCVMNSINISCTLHERPTIN